MTTRGTGIFYDGITSNRREVAVGIGRDAIEIRSPGGALVARWHFADISPVVTSVGVLQVGLANARTSARLEIRGRALATALLARANSAERTSLAGGATRTKIVGLSLAAITILLGGAIWSVPLRADRIAPYLPVALETRLGAAIDMQVRQMLGTSLGRKPFECGSGDSPRAAAARAAFAKLIAPLEAAAKLPVPLRALVVRRPDVNAVTLPGGRIYVFDGLLTKAASVDEVAGVLGHEIGHIGHRDGTKSVLDASGLSLLFGLLRGDFTDGTAMVGAARTLLQNAYSRKAEAAADEFGARLMYKAGGDPGALGAILLRISGHPVAPHFLLDQPQAQQRADAIARIGQPSQMRALLTPPEWQALRTICTEG